MTVVCWLLARPSGDTFQEMAARFRWSPDQLREVLDHLGDRSQVALVGQRYVAAPEGAWRMPR